MILDHISDLGPGGLGDEVDRVNSTPRCKVQQEAGLVQSARYDLGVSEVVRKVDREPSVGRWRKKLGGASTR